MKKTLLAILAASTLSGCFDDATTAAADTKETFKYYVANSAHKNDKLSLLGLLDDQKYQVFQQAAPAYATQEASFITQAFGGVVADEAKDIKAKAGDKKNLESLKFELFYTEATAKELKKVEQLKGFTAKQLQRINIEKTFTDADSYQGEMNATLFNALADATNYKIFVDGTELGADEAKKVLTELAAKTGDAAKYAIAEQRTTAQFKNNIELIRHAKGTTYEINVKGLDTELKVGDKDVKVSELVIENSKVEAPEPVVAQVDVTTITDKLDAIKNAGDNQAVIAKLSQDIKDAAAANDGVLTAAQFAPFEVRINALKAQGLDLGDLEDTLDDIKAKLDEVVPAAAAVEPAFAETLWASAKDAANIITEGNIFETLQQVSSVNRRQVQEVRFEITATPEIRAILGEDTRTVSFSRPFAVPFTVTTPADLTMNNVCNIVSHQDLTGNGTTNFSSAPRAEVVAAEGVAAVAGFTITRTTGGAPNAQVNAEQEDDAAQIALMQAIFNASGYCEADRLFDNVTKARESRLTINFVAEQRAIIGGNQNFTPSFTLYNGVVENAEDHSDIAVFQAEFSGLAATEEHGAGDNAVALNTIALQMNEANLEAAIDSVNTRADALVAEINQAGDIAALNEFGAIADIYAGLGNTMAALNNQLVTDLNNVSNSSASPYFTPENDGWLDTLTLGSNVIVAYNHLTNILARISNMGDNRTAALALQTELTQLGETNATLNTFIDNSNPATAIVVAGKTIDAFKSNAGTVALIANADAGANYVDTAAGSINTRRLVELFTTRLNAE